MTAQLFEFTGNPRPRVTQPESAIVLILPVMRIERDAHDLVSRALPARRGRRERIPIKNGDEDLSAPWPDLPPFVPPNCRCSLTPDRYSMADKRIIFDALMAGDFDTYEKVLASYSEG